MSRLDGRFIKPGSIPADRLGPDVEMGGGLADGSVTPAKLAAGLLGKFVVVTWGQPAVVDSTHQSVTLRLQDLAGADVAASHVVRVTCDSRAALAVGAHGTGLSGLETNDLIARTDASGRLDLVVECEEEIVVSLASGPTQLSPLLDCRTGAELSFV